MVNSIVGQQAERELRIDIMRDSLAMYVGTAAQLQAEGLIPCDLEWPRARADRWWHANGLCYWLRRARPEGHKGPPSSWWDADNWALRVTVEGRTYEWESQRRLERMAEALKREQYRATPDGQRAWTLDYLRNEAARHDAAFQAFKALVPGLVPPKRGRKAKAAA